MAMRSLDVASTGMLAQQTNVEVISNNIANMNTTAFKRQRAQFQDLIYQDMRRVGTPTSAAGTQVPAGVQLGLGVKLSSISRLFEQGALTSTENSLDLAIEGDGFFQIDLPDGRTAYTRDGSFSLNSDGDIVTGDGYTVQPGINVPNEAISITINSVGQVFYSLTDQVDPVEAGQLNLATFVNDNGLEAYGQNLFLETDASGAPVAGNPGDAGFGTVLQGFIESSNVNVVNEITDLISAQRAYEMNSRVVTVSDEMLSTASQIT